MYSSTDLCSVKQPGMSSDVKTVSIDKCYNKRHYLRRIYTFARNNAAPRDNRSRLGAQQLWRHREWWRFH